MTSPSCEVKDGAGAYGSTDGGVNITPANVIVIHLQSNAGVESWSCSCASADELTDVAAINASLVLDSNALTATFTAPVAGRALRFQSRVNLGRNKAGTVDNSYTTTFCLYTVVGGRRVHALDETTEGNAVGGWGADVNALIRAGGGGGASAPTGTGMAHVTAGGFDAAAVALTWTGDTTGTGTGISFALTTGKINGASVPAAGALTTGNALHVSGVSALTYSALNLAGGAGWVTGVLPSANQAAQTMLGDVTGTTAASVVAKVNGVTVSGTPSTAGHVLTATSTTAANWQAPSGGGGISAPTGTGFGHSTAGAWDAASKKVDLTAAADVTVPATANGIITSSGTLLQQPSNVLAGASFISTGATPASTGNFRLSNTGDVRARNAANSADVGLIGLDASNTCFVGCSSSQTLGAALVAVYASATGAVWLGSTSTALVKVDCAAGTVAILGPMLLGGATTTTTNNAKGTAVDRNPTNVQTTDATVTTVDSFTLATGTTIVGVTVVGTKSDNSQGACYYRTAAFRNNAGTVAQIGVTQDGGTFEDDAAWDCTIDNSTTTGRVRVTGKAATTIQWTCTTSILAVIP